MQGHLSHEYRSREGGSEVEAPAERRDVTVSAET